MNKNATENTYEPLLLFLGNEDRKAEGGLRIKSCFKTSDPDKPLISIITVVYNGEKYLEQTIQSVLNQTYDNIEYIIIDGGSRDRTLDIIRQYEDVIDYWVSEKDNGISDAFNKGIRYAQGELIGIINADDWYEEGCIQNLIDNFSKADILYGNLQYWKNYDKGALFLPNKPDLLKKEMVLNHPAIFVKKDVYKKFGLFREDFRYAMDYELLLRFWKNNVSFFYINTVLSNMRYEGISDTHWYNAVLETFKAKTINHENLWTAFIYLTYQMVRSAVARFLPIIGLKNIVIWYREKYSLVKKKNE